MSQSSQKTHECADFGRLSILAIVQVINDWNEKRCSCQFGMPVFIIILCFQSPNLTRSSSKPLIRSRLFTSTYLTYLYQPLYFIFYISGVRQYAGSNLTLSDTFLSWPSFIPYSKRLVFVYNYWYSTFIRAT